MTPSLATALAAYSFNARDIAVRAAYDRDRHAVRFSVPGDDHARTYGVPSPDHVARYVVLPALASATSETPSTVASALVTIPRRHNGGRGSWSPREGRELVADYRDMTRRLSPYYAGLWAAMTLTPASPGAFDRSRYLDDIERAAIDQLTPRALSVSPTPPVPRATRDHQAERAAARAARRDANRSAIEGILGAMIADGTITPGLTIARADLLARVSARLSAPLPAGLVARIVTSLAPDLGLTDRRTARDESGKRSRGFVYTPPSPSEESPMLDMIQAETTARRELNAERERSIALQERELSLLDAQRDAYRSGDRLSALHAHAERHELAGAPNNVIPLRRSTRAA